MFLAIAARVWQEAALSSGSGETMNFSRMGSKMSLK
jgi:hypothetical protein